jgi:hypothetical protein
VLTGVVVVEVARDAEDADVASLLPFHDQNTVTPDQWAARIAARQTGVANRMMG